MTVETCFHYLTLRAEEIPSNATQFKCCPPIRDEQNRQYLLDAVVDGTIDYVVSDHSPCVAELKRGDFMTSWGGVSGLGPGLPLLWTELGSRWSLAGVVAALSSKQAEQVGLKGRKGELVVGADADFVVFDPEAAFEVTLVSPDCLRGADVTGNPAVPEQGLAIPRKDAQRSSAADLATRPFGMGRDKGDQTRTVDLTLIPFFLHPHVCRRTCKHAQGPPLTRSKGGQISDLDSWHRGSSAWSYVLPQPARTVA